MMWRPAMRHKPVAAVAVVCLMALSIAVPSAGEAETAKSKGTKILELLEAGVNHYRVGEYGQAADKFGKIMEMEPDSELALMMRQRAGIGQLVKMLSNPKLAESVQKILILSQEAVVLKRRSADEINGLIAKFRSKELDEAWLAEREIVASGSYAVPFLLDHLDVEQETRYGLTLAERVETRTLAEKAIVDMKSRAVLPLIEGLRSTSTGLRIQVCRLLAKQSDARAVPALRRVVEEREAAPSLRHAANLALAGVAKRAGVSPDRPASECALSLAESYYYGDPRIIDYVPDLKRIIWSWDPKGESCDKRIIYVDVPQYAYNELMVEKLICEALGIGSNQEKLPALLVGARRLAPGEPRRKLLALLAANNYSQLIEARALAAGEPVLGHRQVPEEVRDEAAARAERLEKVHLLNRLIGAPALNDALLRQLKDGDYAQALECIADLRAIADKTIPEAENALLKAMRVGAPSVRFAATEALMRLSPEGAVGGQKQVVANIIAACHTQTLPNIAVITKDKAFYQMLADALREVNCTSERVDSLNRALARTRNQLPFVSMIVLDARAVELPLPTAVATFKQDAVTQFMPLLLLAPPANVEANRTALGKSVLDVVSLNIKPADVAELVKGVFEIPSLATGSLEAARERLISLLKATDDLDVGTRYPIKAAGASVCDLLTKQPDTVRIPAAKALETIGTPAALDQLVTLFLDTETAEELRLAAGRAAVSAISASTAAAPGVDLQQRKALLAIAQDAEAPPELREGAIRIFAVIAPTSGRE